MVIGEIRRYLRDNNSIRVSRSLRDIAYKALGVKETISKKEHRDATIEEIAEKLELPVRKVSYALDAISEIVSLNEPIYNDGSETVRVMDQISDDKASDNTCLENLALYEAMHKLSPREKEIVMLRYYVGKTQMEVSSQVGISQAQVSRLEKNALEIIKKNMI
jgi:RNA polymerase sporulation-specific sigma factor